MGIIVLYCLLVLVMVVGIAGAVIPALPGSSLILVAIIVWGAVKGFSSVTVALGVAIAVFLLSLLVDFLSSYIGAKKAGASDWGQWGAMIGLVLGIFGLLPALPVGGPLIGMFFGPLVGAFVGEFLYRRELELKERVKISLKATVGIIVGTIVGNIIQGVLALATVIVFLITTWSQVMV
jgi:uncharacterized protein